MSKGKFPPDVARVVLSRADGACEALISSSCIGRGQHIHHRQLRSQGGRHSVANCVSICHMCHDWIHANPELAYDWGWLVKSYTDPEETPVRVIGNWLLLSGSYTLCDPYGLQ